MAEEQLRRELDALRAECERLPEVSGPSRERLNRMIADLERKLAEPEAVDHETLVERLQDDLAHFEVEHPGVAAALETGPQHPQQRRDLGSLTL